MPPKKRAAVPPAANPTPDPTPEEQAANEQAAQQRYEDALAAGLSEEEAREVGWPAADASNDEPPAESATVTPVLRADEQQQLVELVEVNVPCRVCYGNGWPEQVEGVHVSCYHGMSLRFGEVAQLTKEQAAAMGFEV